MADGPPDLTVSPPERAVLRRLAGRVAELAARDIEHEKARLWTAHNDLDNTRPLIFCDPENGWNEILTPDQFECAGGLARAWELHLRCEIFWGERMCDDKVIVPWFPVGNVATRTNWGVAEEYTKHDPRGSYAWEPPISDLDDLSALRFPTATSDRPATQRLLSLADELFGDLLPPRPRESWFWTLGLTWEFIKLRGLEAMMTDMCENPDGVHRLMAFLRDGTMAMIEALERDGLLTLNNEGDYVGSGGFGWTRQLPAADFTGTARTRDLWCLSESQETVSVSPEMFAEFVFPYQLPLMERFGLVCYGCCEPLHTRWHVVRRIPNLRRVSVSPWADRAAMAEFLGADYVYSAKIAAHPAVRLASRRGRGPRGCPRRTRKGARLPPRVHHEGQPHHRQRPLPRRALGRDRPRGDRAGGVTRACLPAPGVAEFRWVRRMPGIGACVGNPLVDQSARGVCIPTVPGGAS